MSVAASSGTHAAKLPARRRRSRIAASTCTPATGRSCSAPAPRPASGAATQSSCARCRACCRIRCMRSTWSRRESTDGAWAAGGRLTRPLRRAAASAARRRRSPLRVLRDRKSRSRPPSIAAPRPLRWRPTRGVSAPVALPARQQRVPRYHTRPRPLNRSDDASEIVAREFAHEGGQRQLRPARASGDDGRRTPRSGSGTNSSSTRQGADGCG